MAARGNGATGEGGSKFMVWRGGFDTLIRGGSGGGRGEEGLEGGGDGGDEVGGAPDEGCEEGPD